MDRKDDSLKKREEGSLEEKLGARQQLMTEKKKRRKLNQQHQELEQSFPKSKIDYYEVNRRRVEN